jgi:hypothetical protein
VSKTTVVVGIFFVLAVLHHDFWNWDNKTLWFGFLPVGLGYHAIYSLVAATFWFLVSRFVWPEHVERWAEEGSTAVPEQPQAVPKD